MILFATNAAEVYLQNWIMNRQPPPDVANFRRAELSVALPLPIMPIDGWVSQSEGRKMLPKFIFLPLIFLPQKLT